MTQNPINEMVRRHCSTRRIAETLRRDVFIYRSYADGASRRAAMWAHAWIRSPYILFFVFNSFEQMQICYIYIYTYINIGTYIYIYIYVYDNRVSNIFTLYINPYIYIYLHTYIYIYIHVYAYVYTEYRCYIVRRYKYTRRLDDRIQRDG